jgi:aspartyl-tRNA(Asn)/glutamyl-tRNA(Gln) amidotransferase subunit A
MKVLKHTKDKQMETDITSFDATELAHLIATKQLSPVEIMKSHIEVIEKINPKINALVTLADDSLEKAKKSEIALLKGNISGPLHGVPFTVKDCFDTEGILTTRGSKLFSNYIPTKNATAVNRMLNAGAIVIGKSNMPEFALWWETGNLVFGTTNNPWDVTKTAGGSSGGEAAAIASGMSPIGLGTDVGGSIRQPAHYCGIVGLKPTHGRIPLTGQWPEVLLRYFHVGPMARTVRDVALGLKILSGSDGIDPYSVPVQKPEIPNFDLQLPNLKIGYCQEGPFAPVSKEIQSSVKDAANQFASLGCSVEEIDLSHWNSWPSQSISMAFFLGEGAYYLDPFIKGKEKDLAPSMQKRLNQRTPTINEYLEGYEHCENLRKDITSIMNKFDILLCPTSPTTAHQHDQTVISINNQEVPGRNSLRATIPFDLSGSPALSLPFRLDNNGLPIGVQLVGRHFEETKLLHAASKLETKYKFPQL